jgi:short-subunit dehydrogenase
MEADMAKRALVTGASSGIGAGFVRELAKAGWTVTGVARRVDQMERDLRSLPGSEHRALGADLGTAAGVATVEAELARVPYDLLVNNAGLGSAGLFETTPIERLDGVMRVNVDAVYHLAHAYLRTARRGDALINTASVEGLIPFPGQALYAASKAFVVSLSESLWYEWRARGVYVMGLCPGVTSTPLLASAGTAFDSVPNIMRGTVDDVVATALKALARRRRPTVVPGAVNKTWVFSTRMLTRRATVRIMGSIAPKETLALAPPASPVVVKSEP